LDKYSPGAIRSWCKDLLSSLPETYGVFKSYCWTSQQIAPTESFNYEIIFFGSWHHYDELSWEKISSPSDLYVLECMFLREITKKVGTPKCCVLGVRFCSRSPERAYLNKLNVLQTLCSENEQKAVRFLRNLINDLSIASVEYPLFDNTVMREKISSDLQVLCWFLELIPKARMYKGSLLEFLDKELDELVSPEGIVALLNDLLHAAITEVGLAKVLTIPVLSGRNVPERTSLSEANAARIEIIRRVAFPPYNKKPTMKLKSIRTHWLQIPALFSLYTPVLDFIDKLQKDWLVKICANCGRLFRPYQTEYHKRIHQYCSLQCRKKAEGKRYQRRKEQRNQQKEMNDTRITPKQRMNRSNIS